MNARVVGKYGRIPNAQKSGSNGCCVRFGTKLRLPVLVKATMPLFAVICARVVLHERQTSLVYFSLLPIMAGVLIASLTELSFNMAGLISALLSTSTYALLNVFVKRVRSFRCLFHFTSRNSSMIL